MRKMWYTNHNNKKYVLSIEGKWHHTNKEKENEELQKNCFMSIMKDRCLLNLKKRKNFICVCSLYTSVLNKKKH